MTTLHDAPTPGAEAAAATDARPLRHNSFKPHLLRRAIVRALHDVTGIA